MKSNTILAVEVINEDCVNKLKATAQTVRAQFGSNEVQDAVYVSSSEEAAVQDVEFFFGAGAQFDPTARLQNSTCVIIKPHVVAAGGTGALLDVLLDQGFDVAAAELVTLDKMAAEEFLEVYKTVVPDYMSMVESITTGPCVALEICGEDIVAKVREFIGPSDPEIARHLRPVRILSFVLPFFFFSTCVCGFAVVVLRGCFWEDRNRCGHGLASTRCATPSTAPTCPRTVCSRLSTFSKSCTRRASDM